MALFSRRELQRCIDENARFLSPRQAKRHVEDLNRQTDVLRTIWEVVVLNAFAQFGKVEHETNRFGSRRPDILFTGYRPHPLSLIADITTISDDGRRKLFPLEAFMDFLYARCSAAGIEGRDFKCEIKRLPGEAHFDKVFDAAFDEFLRQLPSAPESDRVFEAPNYWADVRLTYMPGSTSRGVSYAVSDMRSVTQNTLADALKDKYSQLSDAPLDLTRGIVVCDGRSPLLAKRSTWETPIHERIVRAFLENETREPCFVAAFYVDLGPGLAGLLLPQPRVVADVYCNEQVGTREADFSRLILDVCAALPRPRIDPLNARSWARELDLNEGVPFREFLYQGEEIRVPLRGLMSLLGGHIGLNQFLDLSRQEPDDSSYNPFEEALSRGELPEWIRIEHTDEDDDWVVIRILRRPDPAISAFRSPDRSEG